MAKSLVYFLSLASTCVLAAQQAVSPYGAGHAAPADPADAANATAAAPEVTNRIYRSPYSYCYKPSSTGIPLAGNVTSGPTANVSATTGAGPGSGEPTLAASDVTITQLLTSFTTVCPHPTSFAVNNVTYTVQSSTVLTITHCPGGCRVTRPATDIAQATVTAIVSRYTTHVGGPIASPSSPSEALPAGSNIAASSARPNAGPSAGPNNAGPSAGPNAGASGSPTAGAVGASNSDTEAGPIASSKPTEASAAGPHAGYTAAVTGGPSNGVSAGPIAGPHTVTINGQVTTVSTATVLTVSNCPGGCTVTTALSALVQSAQTPSEYAPVTSAAPNGTAAPAAPYASPAAANGTVSTPLAAPTGSAAGPGRNANATVPVQSPQTGGATARDFSFVIVLLAWVATLL